MNGLNGRFIVICSSVCTLYIFGSDRESQKTRNFVVHAILVHVSWVNVEEDGTKVETVR